MDNIVKKSKSYRDRTTVAIRKLVARTAFESSIRRAWWRLQILNKPYMRRAIESDLSIDRCLRRVLRKDSNCLDVGCHKGHILQHMVRHAPLGCHVAFEPIPELAEYLRGIFENSCVQVREIALSNFNGESTFYEPIENRGYSGLRRQLYPAKEQAVREFVVNVRMLDDVLTDKLKLDLIKIDVEGAEMMVLEGAVETIKREQPYIIFEHGLKAAATFSYSPGMIYKLITESLGLQISLLSDWLAGKPTLSAADFISVASKSHGDFLAHP